MLKKDSIAFGALVGLILPGILFGILSLVAVLIETGSEWTRPFEPDRLPLVALVINVIPIRIYFVTYKFDRSGRGVLLVTFLLMVVFFAVIRYF
jgi:hypothetical protein